MMLGDEHKYTPAPHPAAGGSMPSEVQRDPPTLVHEGQDTNVALYSTDAATIEDLKKAMREANFAESTVKTKANALLAFGRWLHKKGKPGFTGRLDTPSLEKDLQDYWGPGSWLRGRLPPEEEFLQLLDTAVLQGTYRRVAVVDVTTPTTTSSSARIGPSGPTASFNVANGSVPDNPTKWGDWLTLGSSDSLRK
ncbi:hypothetical protein GR243_39930 [Rhizobium leguminosarum]|nr:hypothetical protein [Rhizobium leguminosarum]